MNCIAVVDGDDATVRRLLTHALQSADLSIRAFEDEITVLAGWLAWRKFPTTYC